MSSRCKIQALISRLSPKPSKSRVKDANNHEDRRDEMKIDAGNLTECQRWCVHEQRIHDENICEEEETCDLSDLVIIPLLEICITPV